MKSSNSMVMLSPASILFLASSVILANSRSSLMERIERDIPVI